jgi:UDP-glucuronate decarboxylase
VDPALNDSRKSPISVFLTGGTGFFGRALLRHIDRGFKSGSNRYAVTVMTRSVNCFLHSYPEFQDLPWLDFHEGDVLHGETGFPRDAQFSHVLHAAADSTNGPKMRLLDRYDQIVMGTRNALDFALRAGASRFLLTSSGDVYGAQPAEMESLSESYCGMPDAMVAENTYGIAKRQAEHLCALYANSSGLGVVVARCFTFVGPDLPMNAHFAIGNFIRDALAGSEIVIKGDGKPIRSYLDQDDLAFWLLRLLECGRSGEAYNVGSDEAITIAELAEMVRDLLAPQGRIKFLFDDDRNLKKRARYIPSIDKVKAELGLNVAIAIKDSILTAAQSVSSKK